MKHCALNLCPGQKSDFFNNSFSINCNATKRFQLIAVCPFVLLTYFQTNVLNKVFCSLCVCAYVCVFVWVFFFLSWVVSFFLEVLYCQITEWVPTTPTLAEDRKLNKNGMIRTLLCFIQRRNSSFFYKKQQAKSILVIDNYICGLLTQVNGVELIIFLSDTGCWSL